MEIRHLILLETLSTFTATHWASRVSFHFQPHVFKHFLDFHSQFYSVCVYSSCSASFEYIVSNSMNKNRRWRKKESGIQIQRVKRLLPLFRKPDIMLFNIAWTRGAHKWRDLASQLHIKCSQIILSCRILRHIVFILYFRLHKITLPDIPTNVDVDVNTKAFHFVVFGHISHPNTIKAESYFLRKARANRKYISYIVYIIVFRMYSQNCEENGLAEARITKFACSKKWYKVAATRE